MVPVKNVPAKVTMFDRANALIMPLDIEAAPSALKSGHWVPRRDLRDGEEGVLSWVQTASFGLWSFCPNRKPAS